MRKTEEARINATSRLRSLMVRCAEGGARCRSASGVIRRFLPLLLVILAAACDASVASTGRMVMVVSGGLSIRDISDPSLPNLIRLLSEGSLGLMNVRTGRPSSLQEPTLTPGMEAVCVSLGAGAMAVGGAEVRRAADAAEQVVGGTAAEVYAFRTGTRPGRARVLHTEIARIRRANESAPYRARPGALGSALRKAGVGAAVIGNSDIPGEPHREVVAVVMDEAGRVDFGSVSSERLLEPAARSPYGVHASITAALDELDSALRVCRFVVIDFGDTFRADCYANLCTDEQAARLRKQAVRRLDGLLGAICARLDFSKDALLLVSPSWRIWSDLEGERLTPIVAFGPGFGKGALGSPSTRKPGLVTICDVAPTVLTFFGIDVPPEMVGRPMTSCPVEGALDHALRMNLDATVQGQRQPAMRGASVVQSVLVALVTLIAFFGTASRARRAAGWAALVPAVLPLVMLYLGLLGSGGLLGTVLWLIALTLLCIAVCRLLFRSPTHALVWLCGLIMISLIVDVVRGAPLISSSIAGYSMVEGARYYGIGNELAGTLIGAALVGVGLALGSDRWRLRYPDLLAACAFAVVFVGIGSSGLGANAGAAASAAPAIVVALLARRGWKPSLKGTIAVFVLSAVVLGAVFAADILRGGGSQSHIGRAAGLAASGDGLTILALAQRKLALNFMLLSTSVWSRLLGLSLLGSALLYWRGRSIRGEEFLTRERCAAALGCCVATLFAFLLNDSGVLAAAACSVFLWMLLVLALLDTNDNPRTQTG